MVDSFCPKYYCRRGGVASTAKLSWELEHFLKPNPTHTQTNWSTN